jgi:DNA-binding transcriptional ArsR family regulator
MAELGLDEVFIALANPSRRAVVELLALGPATVTKTADHVGLSLPAIDRHLDILVAAGLIQRRKHGRTNFLAIRRAGLRLLRDWIALFNVDWGSDEETLENYLDSLTSQTE